MGMLLYIKQRCELAGISFFGKGCLQIEIIRIIKYKNIIIFVIKTFIFLKWLFRVQNVFPGKL